MKIRQIVEKIKPAADQFAAKKMHIYAAASDYYLFVSLIPLLMLLVSFVRFLPFDQEKISDKCVCCGKPAVKMVYWGRAY